MGCVSSKKTPIQQKPPKQHTPMQQSNDEPSHQTTLLISQLSSLLISQQIDPQVKPELFNKKLEPDVEANCNRISCYFLKKLNTAKDLQSRNLALQQCLIVCDGIVKHTAFIKGFENLGVAELNELATFIEGESNGEVLDSFVRFVEGLFLEHDHGIYSKVESIFKVLILKFGEYTTDAIRELATQILVQMLIENKKLLKYANQPYHFMQFWLYLINEQSQLDRQLYWIECVKKIYASDKTAQDCLLYDTDFRVFVDVLVRVIEKCPDGKTLRVPLECYLVLSCTNKMHPNLHRLNDIKDYISAINGETLGIPDLFNQINSLK